MGKLNDRVHKVYIAGQEPEEPAPAEPAVGSEEWVERWSATPDPIGW